MVSLDPQYPTGQVGTPLQAMGITRGFDDHPDGSDVRRLTTPTCGGQCAYRFTNQAMDGISPTAECIEQVADPVGRGWLAVKYTRQSSAEVQVYVMVRARDQCETLVPQVHTDLTIAFRQLCDGNTLGPVEFKAWGVYDGYPWYELYLNGSPVFFHDPCLTGEGPLSMFGSGEHYFHVADEDHEPPTGIPLGEWQPVPGQ